MACDPVRQKFKTEYIQYLKDRFSRLNDEKWILGIAKVLPWSETEAEETTPVINTDSVMSDTDFFRRMIAAKRILPENIMFVIPRIDWTRGEIYDAYRDDVDLFDDDEPSKFYVLVDESRVYKCIDNNNGAASNESPTHTDATIRKLSDGYRWKFLYQLTDTNLNFLTKNSSKVQAYMPVEYVDFLTSAVDQRSLQYSVQNAAVDGAIDFIEITSTGQPFAFAIPASSTNQVVADAATGATFIQIAGSGLSQLLNTYRGYDIKIESGDGAGQQRRIESYIYNGVSYKVYFDDPLDYAVSAVAGGSGSYYSILPHLKIEGDGSNNSNTLNTSARTAEATIRINSDRVIESIEMIDPGKDYTYAKITVEPEDPTKTFDAFDGDTTNSATARAIMSPKGGHGSNPVKELGASHIMLFVELISDEGGDFPIENDYRQFALIKNANLSIPQQRLLLHESSTTGSFTEGVSGYNYSDPSLYGTIQKWLASSITGHSEIWLTNVTGGTFQAGMTFSSGAVDRTINDVDIRTVAGTEGFMCRKLHLISAFGATQNMSASDFYINGYAIGVGNTSDYVGASNAFGEVVTWNLTPGSNKSGDLYLDKTTDLWKLGEDIAYLSRDFTTYSGAIAEINKIQEDELYTPTTYSMLYKLLLTYNGTDEFTTTTFLQDEQVFGISGGIEAGATAQWSAYVVDWSPSDDGTTGTISLLALESINNGVLEVSQTFNGTYSDGSYKLVATISEISERPELEYHSGTIEYLQNINAVSRRQDQTEEIKIIIGT